MQKLDIKNQLKRIKELWNLGMLEYFV